MVSSSDRETVKAGPAYDSGVELFTPPTPQNSGIDHHKTTKKAFIAPARF